MMTKRLQSRTTRLAAAAVALGTLGHPATAQNWYDQLAGGGVSMLGVDFPVDTSTGYVVGYNGYVRKTTDGGRNWVLTIVSPATILLAVEFTDNTNGYISGFNGRVYRTTDGGDTWDDTLLSGNLYAINFPLNERIGYVGGKDGGIWKTCDAGDNWVIQDYGSAETVRTIDFPSGTNIGWASANNGTITKRDGVRVVCGVYTGDGTDDRAITGVGFSPDVLLIKGDDTKDAIFVTSTMTAGQAKRMGPLSAGFTNRVESLDADGFTVGDDDDVNESGIDYYWAAWDAVAGETVVNTYTGNGADNRSITGVGFQPAYVQVFAIGGNALIMHHFATQGDQTFRGYSNLSPVANAIQAMEADGFQIGTHPYVNWNGATYHYVAYADTANTAQSNYTGDGTDDRAITGAGMRPQVVFIEVEQSGSYPGFRLESMIGDASTTFVSNFALTADAMQSLDDDGLTVGTISNVSSGDYHWMGWGGKWSTQTSGVAGTLWHVKMRDENDGWIAGNDDAILKTSDGGATWIDKSTGTGEHWTDVSAPISLSEAVIVGGSGTIMGTDDGGDTWTAHTTPGSNILWNVSCPEDLASCWVAGNSATILRTAPPVVKTGTYLGTGASQSVTGMGFQPDVVIVTGADGPAVIRTSTMSGDQTKPLDDSGTMSLQTDRIESLDADGFTIGTDDDVSKNSNAFFWVAFGAQHEMALGSYTGNDASGRQITDPGFSPDWVVVMGDHSAAAVQRFSTMTGDLSSTFGDAAPTSGYITGFHSTGFTVSDATEVNASSNTYHWIAVKEVADQVEVGSYTGDSFQDPLTISGLGFEPDYVIIKGELAEACVQRPRSIGRRDTSLGFGTEGTVADRIQKLDDDGFEVGADNDVNQTSKLYHWIAFARDWSQNAQTPMVIQWQELDPR